MNQVVNMNRSTIKSGIRTAIAIVDSLYDRIESINITIQVPSVADPIVFVSAYVDALKAQLPAFKELEDLYIRITKEILKQIELWESLISNENTFSCIRKDGMIMRSVVCRDTLSLVIAKRFPDAKDLVISPIVGKKHEVSNIYKNGIEYEELVKLARIIDYGHQGAISDE